MYPKRGKNKICNILLKKEKGYEILKNASNIEVTFFRGLFRKEKQPTEIPSQATTHSVVPKKNVGIFRAPDTRIQNYEKTI
jgi:hypothetical protein